MMVVSRSLGVNAEVIRRMRAYHQTKPDLMSLYPGIRASQYMSYLDESADGGQIVRISRLR